MTSAQDANGARVPDHAEQYGPPISFTLPRRGRAAESSARSAGPGW